jgi:small-conductance mechanosensitive channel
MFDFREIFNINLQWQPEYGETLAVLAAAIFLSYLLIKIIEGIALARLRNLSKSTESKIDDLVVKVIDKLNWPFYLSVSLVIAINFAEIPIGIESFIEKAVFIIVIFYIVRGSQEVIDFSLLRLVQANLDSQQEQDFDPTIVNFLGNVIKFVMWLLAFVIILQNLGFNVTALVGGLGIMGIAIGFALQSVLEDVFSFISIYFDKPFKKGDFIVLQEGKMGTVEHIGIKSTRVRTLKGQELVVPNTELTAADINNFSDMETRRIQFNIGVAYETERKKLEKINDYIKEIIEGIENVEFRRSHLKEFGDSALIFEVVFVVNDNDYNVYMDIRQKINFAILKKLEKEGIEIAYPTQKIFLNK